MFLSIRILAISLLATSFFGPAFAQELLSDLDCHDRWLGRNSHTHCEIREFTIPARDLLIVDGDSGPTGDVRVTGWDQDDVRVRARVIAWAPDKDAASNIAHQVVIRTDGVLQSEQHRESGESWSFVDYEISAPHRTAMRVGTRNGSIAIADLSGELDLETTNGKIKISGASNTIMARSTNGAIAVDLAQTAFERVSIDLETTNGAVTLRAPESFSAELDARSVNGGIHVNLPLGTPVKGAITPSGRASPGVDRVEDSSIFKE